MTARQHPSALWFALPLAAVYAAAFVVVAVLPRASAPGAVAVGLTLDLVVLVPGLYYVVLVRGRGWPAITLAPVFLLSFGAASLVVPGEHHGLLRAIGYALPVVELALAGAVGYKALRVIRASRSLGRREADFYHRTRRTLRAAFDVPAVAGALAYEVSLFYYAFALRRVEPPEHAFSSHRRSGYGAVLVALLMVAALELVGVHFLLRSWSEAAALVHAALSGYGIVWLVGDYRAMRRRPHELRAEGLYVRHGLRWDLAVAWDRVAAVRRARRPESERGYLNTAPLGDPRYIVELRAPAEATGPYGITREVRRVGLIVDEPGAFEERLRRLGVRVEG
jgi:hypothetical protein